MARGVEGVNVSAGTAVVMARRQRRRPAIPKPRLLRWEKRAEWPLAAVSVAFLAMYSVQVLARPGATTAQTLTALMSVLYVVFVVDFVVRLALSGRPSRWLLRHLLDLAVVTLPFLQPLRVLRLIVLLGTLQRAFGDAVRGRVAAYTGFSVVLMVYAASLAVLQAERSDPHANIVNFGDAVWWSIATITTVGYGDLYPVTGQGRLIAVLLMIGGISLIGVVTGTVSSWIVQRVSEGGAADRVATATQIDQLRSEIGQLSRKVDAGFAGASAGSGYR